MYQYFLSLSLKSNLFSASDSFLIRFACLHTFHFQAFKGGVGVDDLHKMEKNNEEQKQQRYAFLPHQWITLFLFQSFNSRKAILSKILSEFFVTTRNVLSLFVFNSDVNCIYFRLWQLKIVWRLQRDIFIYLLDNVKANSVCSLWNYYLQRPVVNLMNIKNNIWTKCLLFFPFNFVNLNLHLLSDGETIIWWKCKTKVHFIESCQRWKKEQLQNSRKIWERGNWHKVKMHHQHQIKIKLKIIIMFSSILSLWLFWDQIESVDFFAYESQKKDLISKSLWKKSVLKHWFWLKCWIILNSKPFKGFISSFWL